MKFLFTLVLLLTIQLNADSANAEYFYVSISGLKDHPEPVITAERTDNRTRWFDDQPRAKSKYDAEFGLFFPRDYQLILRYKQIEGTHLGAASRYQCFFKFCAWISSSIVSGLASNDQIDYRLRSGEIWVQKAPFDSLPQLGFRAGVNVIHAQVTFAGSGIERTEQGIVPLPFIGYEFKQRIFDNLRLEFDGNYSKINLTHTGVTFRDASAGVILNFTKQTELSVGIKKFSLDSWYQKDSVTSSWTIPQTTPYLKLTFRY